MVNPTRRHGPIAIIAKHTTEAKFHWLFSTILPVSDNRRLRPGMGRWFAQDAYASAVSRIHGDTLEAGFRPQKGIEYSVVATVYFKDKKSDVSNILKGLLDGIFGAREDAQVVDVRLIKKLDKERPRVELEICEILE